MLRKLFAFNLYKDCKCLSDDAGMLGSEMPSFPLSGNDDGSSTTATLNAPPIELCPSA